MLAPTEFEDPPQFFQSKFDDSIIPDFDDNSEDKWTAARCERILRDLHNLIDVVRYTVDDMNSRLRGRNKSSGKDNNSVENSPLSLYGERGLKAEKNWEAQGRRSDIERLGGPEFGAEWHHVLRPANRVKNTYTAKLREARRKGVLSTSDSQHGTKEKDFTKAELQMPSKFCQNRTAKNIKKDDRISDDGTFNNFDTKCARHKCLLAFSDRNRVFPKPRGTRIDGAAKDSGEWVASGSKYVPQHRTIHILNYLSVLFEKSTLGTRVRRVGANSLLSTCVGELAKDIAAEDDDSQMDAPKSKAYSISPVYKELEDCFSSGPPNSGWQPLRDLTRYHAVHILSERLYDRQLPLQHMMCLLHYVHADEEAELLYDATLNHEQNALALESPCMSMLGRWSSLEGFASRTGRYSFAFRKMALFLEDYWVPTYSLQCRDLVSCMDTALEAITDVNDESPIEDDHEESAALLLRTIVKQSYLVWACDLPEEIHQLRLSHSKRGERQQLSYSPDRLENDKPALSLKYQDLGDRQARVDFLKNGSFNALAILLATEILRQKGLVVSESPIRNTKVLIYLRQMGIEARQYIEIMESAGIERAQKIEEVMIPLLAAVLATLIANEGNSKITKSPVSREFATILRLGATQSELNHAGSFLSKIALHCAPATCTDNEFVVMHDIFNYLDNIRGTSGREAEARKFIDQIKIAAALGLCRHSSRPDRQEWAMNISQTASPDKVASSTGTPIRKIARYSNGYRWEEGISEWVEQTPLPLLLKYPDASDSEEGERSLEDRSPTRSRPQLWRAAVSKPNKQPIRPFSSETMTLLQQLPDVDENGKTSHGSELARSIKLMRSIEILQHYRNRIEVRNSSDNDHQPETRSENATPAFSSHPCVSNPFQSNNSNNEDDWDELSTLHTPMHQVMNLKVEPNPQQERLKRQRSAVQMASQDSKRNKTSAGQRAPSWRGKRTPEVEDMEDELGV